MRTTTIITQVAAVGLMAMVAEGAAFRYNGSGDWNNISNGDSGWGLNPNNPPVASGSLPSAGDDARINFGGNTVTVSSAVPDVNRVQVGVDEDGNLIVANGGSLTSIGDSFIGNNNDNVNNSSLTVLSGGSFSVGGILWSSNALSIGNISIESGGNVTVGNHLWLGVTNVSDISIAGTLTQTSGILGLGTNNASTPGGGTASLSILDGGVFNLNNIAGGGGSIQPGSVLDIQGSGRLRLPGDFVGSINSYIGNNQITGNGTPGAVSAFFDADADETIVTAIPEPSSALLLGLAGALGFCRRKR